MNVGERIKLDGIPTQLLYTLIDDTHPCAECPCGESLATRYGSNVSMLAMEVRMMDWWARLRFHFNHCHKARLT